MKVITMESSAFRSLTEQIAEIAAHVRAASGDKKAASPDRLLTTREAAHLLNVSTRTLQRMRSEQRIGYVVLRGKCRYRQSEIDRLLDESTVNEDAATPQELKRNHTPRTGGKPKGRRTWVMELLTRNNFEGWMQKLMERLDRQDELLLAMKAEGKQPTITESIRLFDNQDLCMLLQISKRTLQRYRSVGALPYKTLGKKTYYSEEDVLTFLSNHIKDFKKEDIAFYKARIHNFFHK